MSEAIYCRNRPASATGNIHPLLLLSAHATFSIDDTLPPRHAMSWALDEFFAGVEEEFGVPIGEADDHFLETPGAVIDFVVENSEPTDGMTDDEYRDHVAGVIGEIMARTLGVTRYSEDSRFVQDLHVR